jgi:hypothetical protein
MARKKQKRRHRRVGAVGFGGKKGAGMKLLAVAGGFLLGDTINTQLDKVLPKTKNATTNVDEPNQTIGIVAEIGLGGLLLMRKKQSMPITLAGGVLAGAGLKRVAKKMGLLSGYQSVPVIGRHKMAGYQSVPVIGSLPSQLSGRMPSQLQGFRVNGYVPTGSAGVMNGFDNGSGVGGGCME